MAFTPIKNQPIIFNQQTPCYFEPQDYTYNYRANESTVIGFELRPCDDAEVNTLNDIAVTTGWTFDDDIYTSTGGTGVITITNDIQLNTRALWLVTIEVQELNSGILVFQVAGWGSFNIQAAGTYEIYVSTDFATSSYQLISVGFDGSISLQGAPNNKPLWQNVNTFNLVHVLDSNDNVVDTLLPTIANNLALYNFNLANYALGCYRLAYIDGCDDFAGRFQGICNGLPTSNLECWTNNGSGAWSFDDSFFFEQESGSGVGRLANGTLLEVGYTYKITFDLETMTKAQFRMTWLDESENTTQIGPLLSTGDLGVHTFSYTPTENGYLQLQFIAPGASSEGKVKNVIVELTGPFQYDGISPCICNQGSSECSIKLSGCFSDTFVMEGVVLDNEFQPSLRLVKSNQGDPNVKLFKKQYLSDATKYRDSQGRNQINFFDVQPSYILRIENQPEFIFDYIFQMWAGFDNMLINDAAYRINADQFPVIEWSDKTGLGSVDIEVIPFQTQTRKVLCGVRNQPCEPITPTVEVGMLYESGEGMEFNNSEGDGMDYDW